VFQVAEKGWAVPAAPGSMAWLSAGRTQPAPTTWKNTTRDRGIRFGAACPHNWSAWRGVVSAAAAKRPRLFRAGLVVRVVCLTAGLAGIEHSADSGDRLVAGEP
jgi:hypothetical protein